ncbi:MAG: AMP-binding protein [Acidobacteriia bacterium]|nr:AMP-binding protein [Terriglobia bacterium]
MTPEEAFAEMVADGEIVLDKLDFYAARLPDKIFIHYGEDDTRLTFAEFKRRSDALAAGLAEMDVMPGDRVSVLTRNSLVTALSMFAIWRAGAVFAPVNFNLIGELLSYQLKDTAPAALITDVSFAGILSTMMEELPIERFIIHAPRLQDHDYTGAQLNRAFAGKQVVSFTDACENAGRVPSIPRGPFDLANIIYTSGTTGPSKGVLQGFRWLSQYTFLSRMLGTEEDIIYCDLPLYHVGGAFALLARAVWRGNTIGLWDRFSASHFWDRIEECGASSCILLDVMVPWLMSAAPRASDRANTINRVHMQPLPANHHEVARRFGFDFVTAGFGQTESGHGFAALIDEFGDEEGTLRALYRGFSKDQLRATAGRYGFAVVDGAKPLPKGFMGKPSPLLEAAIVDEHDNLCPPGVVGQLAFRPRFQGLLLQQYFNKPEATLKALRNCWFHTGDACSALEDGTFVFVDRMGGYFRVRGETVSSYDVETLINTHPKVRATAAVPVPARVGEEEEIAVFIQLVEGETLTEEELRDHARALMPKYMVPTHVRFIEALPLTPTSKVEKYKLKRRILDELGIAPRT